jgi:hypothetical protein
MSSEQPRRNRNWLWFFLVLALLAAVAVGIPLFYEPLEPLTIDRLRQARALWEQHRPPNYRLEYTKQGNARGTFVITVRDGKVKSVTLQTEGPPIELEPRLYDIHDMTGLLDDIETLLKRDAQPNAPAATNRGRFSPEDGHLVRFVRSVPAENYKLGIRVKELKVLGNE